MKVTYGRGTTVYGPGVEVKLTGDEVAEAILNWIGTKGVQIKGPRTVRSASGELMTAVEVYVDPSGVVETPDGSTFSGRGRIWTDEEVTCEALAAASAVIQDEPRGGSPLFRCDVCGRYISWSSLEAGRATHKPVTPDSDVSSETYETLCSEHSPNGKSSS